MLGIYTFDYGTGSKPMDPVLFEAQLTAYDKLLRDGKIEGVIFCSSTLGDADLETNRILRDYVKNYGDDEIIC